MAGPVKIAINGFGRIGRNLFRLLLSHPEIEVVAINDIHDAGSLAHLLRYDSIHGRIFNDIFAGDNEIIVDGRSIPLLNFEKPADIP